MPLFPRKSRPRTPNPEAQMELMEHLAELRTRIVRSVVMVVVGMVVTYNLFDYIFTLLKYPLDPILRKQGGVLIYNSLQDAFLLRMQVCLISGIVVAFPFVVLELWGFIAPALTSEERRPVRYLAPFSVLLFVAGVVTAYAALPTAYGWMASYIPDVPDTHLYQNSQAYLLLTAKLLLAFGASFQLPIVLLFLARVGLITAELMQKYWRHATVGIATAAAILTPSNDPLTMMMMAVPMAGLYLLSIGLVRAFEPRADGVRSGPSLATMVGVALAPIVIVMASGYWLYRVSPGARAATPGASAPAVTALAVRTTASPAPTPPAAAATPPTAGASPTAPAAMPSSPTPAGKAAAPAPAATPDADIATLRREVEALQSRVTALESQRR